MLPPLELARGRYFATRRSKGLRAIPHVLYGPHMPKDTQTPDWITTAEVASMLGIHVATVVRKAQAGDIPIAMKVPGETGPYLFDRSVIEALVAA